MSKNIENLLSLEEQLTSVESDALDEERDNARKNYNALNKEYDAVDLPFPEVKPYDTSNDLNEIADLQFKKGRNKAGWDLQKQIKKYCDNDRLHCGHVRTVGGHDYFFMDSFDLPTRSIGSASLVNVDDRGYADKIRMWQYPAQYKEAVFSRNISMGKYQVRNVDIVLDRSQQMLSDITDAYLRKALLRNKEKTGIQSIIQTIQKKQDDIRQLPAGESFIVQGCAGSGKTMVLLHRLRYLVFNKDINSADYLLLVPTNSFKRFIGDISAKFKIEHRNILPIQHYYQMLMGKKIDQNNQDISELVFDADYLKNVYSKEFMREAYQQLFDAFLIQINALIEFCENKLNLLISVEEESIEADIKNARRAMLTSAAECVEKVENYIHTSINSIHSIYEIISEIEEAYSEAKEEYDAASVPENEIVISPEDIRIKNNSDLNFLQNDIAAEKERVRKASIFTVSAHRRKLAKLEERYAEVYAEIEAKLIEVDKRIYAERAAKLRFVYDGITIEDVEQIIKDLELVVKNGEVTIETLQKRRENITEYLAEKYEQEIHLLNQMIELSSAVVQDGNRFVEALEPSADYFGTNIGIAQELWNCFSSYISDEDETEVGKRFKMFASRSKQQLEAYLNNLLFNTCKRLIKNQYGLVICNLYKHYWYLALYCQYLTRSKDVETHRIIFIDEAQDLSFAELELIYKINSYAETYGEFSIMNTPTMNVFGDINQMITSHGIKDWGEVDFISDQYTLAENFRNTNQIVDYCNRSFPFKMQKIGVDMEAVDEYKTLNDALRNDPAMKNGTVFVVKDEYAVADLRQELKLYPVSEYDIYTIKSVKGLEFKQVYVFDREMTVNEKYIAYTRALSKLVVINNLPHFVDNSIPLYQEGDESGDQD